IYNFLEGSRAAAAYIKVSATTSGPRPVLKLSKRAFETRGGSDGHLFMKMTEEVERLTVDDDEVTLVAPRFDEEETLVARRVVPLEAVGGAARAATRAAAPVPARQPRRSRVLALAFASALGGGVLGGGG